MVSLNVRQQVPLPRPTTAALWTDEFIHYPMSLVNVPTEPIQRLAFLFLLDACGVAAEDLAVGVRLMMLLSDVIGQIFSFVVPGNPGVTALPDARI